MTNITIDPAGQKLTAVIESTSAHDVGIDLTVFDHAGNVVEEFHDALDNSRSKARIDLGKKPSFYDDCDIQVTLSFKSPTGDDAIPYSATYTLEEDGERLDPDIRFSGKTKGGSKLETETFHVDKK